MRAHCHHQMSLPGFSFCLGHQLKWFNCLHSNRILWIPLFLLSPHLLDSVLSAWPWHEIMASVQIPLRGSRHWSYFCTKCMYDQSSHKNIHKSICSLFLGERKNLPGNECVGGSLLHKQCCSAVAKGCAFLSSRLRLYLPNITCQLK